MSRFSSSLNARGASVCLSRMPQPSSPYPTSSCCTDEALSPCFRRKCVKKMLSSLQFYHVMDPPRNPYGGANNSLYPLSVFHVQPLSLLFHHRGSVHAHSSPCAGSTVILTKLFNTAKRVRRGKSMTTMARVCGCTENIFSFCDGWRGRGGFTLAVGC